MSDTTSLAQGSLFDDQPLGPKPRPAGSCFDGPERLVGSPILGASGADVEMSFPAEVNVSPSTLSMPLRSAPAPVDSGQQHPGNPPAHKAHGTPYSTRTAPDANAAPVRQSAKRPSAASGGTVPEAKFLDVRAVGALYGVGVATVWRWAKNGQGFPPPVKISNGATRWRIADLEDFNQSLSPKPRSFTVEGSHQPPPTTGGARSRRRER